jgi:WD40 repeat protein
MPAKPHSIFVSYARGDGRALAGELRQELESSGFRLWQDVVDMQAGETWWLQITAAIEGSAVMVVLLTEAALSSPVVRDELSHARRVGTHAIPVVRNAELLDQAPEWITRLDVVILDERHPDHEVSRQRLYRQLHDPPPRRPRPFSAPNLPLYFVPRPRELDRLVARLLGPERRNPVAITTALQGGGGFGKTTLAIALCHDQRIREAFDDGILWVQFQPQTTPAEALARLNDQIGLLDPEGQRFSDLAQASARFRQLLSKRDILVVLDDVWSEAVLLPFIHKGTAYLITTRRQPVVATVGADPVIVDELLPEEATVLLSRWISREPSAEETLLLRELAAALGQWALLVELVGAELRALMSSGRSLPEAVSHVRRRLDRHGFTYLDRNDEANRNAAIGQSLNASLTLLASDQRRRFHELAILSEDTNVPFETVGQLWASTAGYDELDTEDALEALHRLALFTRYDSGARELRIHDVVRRVVASNLGDTSALHRGLVDHWGDLHRLPDVYAWRNLMYHLRAAGRHEVARRLLFDLGWIQAKLRATDPVSLVADYASQTEDADCRLVAAALTMAGLSIADPGQVPAQLVGRLQRFAPDSHFISALLSRAMEYDARPALLPVRVHLPSIDQGIHSTIQTAAPIMSAVVTRDGTSVIAGLANGTVQICDWRKQEFGPPIECGVGPIVSLAIHGDLLAVGGFRDLRYQFSGQTAPVEIWNWCSRERLRLLGGELPDGREGYATWLCDTLLAVTTGEMNNLIHLYDWTTGDPTGTIDPDQFGATAKGNRPGIVAFAGQYLLYHVDGGRQIFVWTVDDRAFHGQIDGQIGLDGVPFVADDGSLVVRSKWASDRPNGFGFFHAPGADDVDPSATIEFRHYDAPVSAVARDGQCLLLCSDVIDARDTTSGELLARLEGHSDRISTIHLVEDAVLTTSYDRTIRVWDRRSAAQRISAHRARSRPAEDSTRFYGASISGLALHDASLFAANEAGQMEEWNWREAAKIREVSVGQPVRCLAVNDRWVVFSQFISLKRGRFHARRRDRWTVEPAARKWKQAGDFTVCGDKHVFPNRAVIAAKLCGDSCALIVENYYTPANSLGWGEYTGNMFYVVDLLTHATEWAGGKWVSALAISERSVVSGTVEGHIEIWQRPTGKLGRRLSGHANRITDLVIREGHLISSSTDQTVRIWDLATFMEVRAIPHGGAVNSLFVRGDMLATASEDHTLRLFRWGSGEELARFTDDAPLVSCAIAGDMATAVAGGRSGHLHVLRANAALRAGLGASGATR